MAKIYIQKISEEDQPMGYAGLDGTGKVNLANLPAQAGAGSVMFGQNVADLTSSRPWRAPGATTFLRATVSVEEAVTGTVTVAEVLVNGVSELPLSLTTGQTIHSASITLSVGAGALATVNRLDLAGGACQIQLDQIAG